jgi:hypothetical protein
MSHKFEIGDIVESRVNKSFIYRVVGVSRMMLKVTPTDRNFRDLEFTCRKRIFTKLECKK